MLSEQVENVDFTWRCGFKDQQPLVQRAVEDGIARYIESRKARVPAFVSQHFQFGGALRLHKKTLGQDLYKVPLNGLWSVPVITLIGQVIGLSFIVAFSQENYINVET